VIVSREGVRRIGSQRHTRLRKVQHDARRDLHLCSPCPTRGQPEEASQEERRGEAMEDSARWP
jgi:hypothetical protein